MVISMLLQEGDVNVSLSLGAEDELFWDIMYGFLLYRILVPVGPWLVPGGEVWLCAVVFR